MITFESPWVALLIILPWLITRFAPPYERRRAALRVNFYDRILAASGGDSKRQDGVLPMSLAQRFVLVLTTALILLAMSGPTLVGEPKIKEEPMRDLLIAIDLSGSMETRDFLSESGKKIDRLEAVKEVLRVFLQQRSGERIGLIFFGSAAFVQSPFTTDIKALERFLDEAQVGMAGPQTMLGDAIGLGLKMFEESKIEERMLILMSDGDDTGSQVPPIKAAELAKKAGVSIFTIGVGDPENAGEHPLDTKTLREIATSTDGAFYYALDRDELINIYKKIDDLRPRLVKQNTLRPTRELFIYPLSVAMLLLFAYTLFALIRRRRV